MKKLIKLALPAALIATFGLIAFSQQVSTISAAAAKTAVAGKAVHGRITIDVPAGFHIYSPTFVGTGVPTVISLKPETGFKLISVNSPKGNLLSGDVNFPFAIMVGKSVRGMKSVSFSVRFQQCNSHICLPAITRTVTVHTLVK